MKELTTKEFSELLGMKLPVASGIIRFFKNSGLIQKVGMKKTAVGKGRTAAVYAFPEELSVPIGKLLAEADKNGESVTEPVEEPEQTPEPEEATASSKKDEPDATDKELANMSAYLDEHGNV